MSAPTKTPTARKKILFVDDDEYGALDLVQIIEAEGLDVKLVSSVREAKDAISAGPPDLAILDVMMRPDVDDSEFETRGGFASSVVLGKWIAKNHPGVRFLGLSAARSPEIVGAAIRSRSMVHCLARPRDPGR